MALFGAPKKPSAAPVVEPPKEPVVTAKPATQEDVTAAIERALGGVGAQLGQALGELREGVQAMARQPIVVQTPGQAPVAQHTTSDDEAIDRALLSGTGGAGLIRSLIDREVNRKAEELVSQHINPLRNFGAESLANLSQELASSKMPYYTRFKKEIDSRLAMLTPEVRANPASIKMIHDSVVGENTQLLIREAAEEAVRKSQEPTGQDATTQPRSRSVTPGTGAAAGVPREDVEIPDAASLGGAEAVDALRNKGKDGMSQDDLARSMGYESWAAYIKQYNDLLKAETRGNA